MFPGGLRNFPLKIVLLVILVRNWKFVVLLGQKLNLSCLFLSQTEPLLVLFVRNCTLIDHSDIVAAGGLVIFGSIYIFFDSKFFNYTKLKTISWSWAVLPPQTHHGSLFLLPPRASGSLQATRALMIVGIIVSISGLGVACMGMKCTTCGGSDKLRKSRVAMTGGIILLVGGEGAVKLLIKRNWCFFGCFFFFW